MKSWIMVLSVAFATLLNADHFYVDASRPDDSGDGTSWATAKRTIQGGVDIAGGYDTVWVTNGVYNEGVSLIGSETSSNRVSFVGKNEIKLLAVSSDPADTVIVGAADPDVSNGCGPKSIRGIRQGSYDKVTVSGFTITNGYSSSSGAGISGYHDTSFKVTNCVVTACNSSVRGGGVAYLTIYDSTVQGCATETEAGGTYLVQAYNVLIAENTAGNNKYGCGGFQGTYWNCVFSNNYGYANGTLGSGGALGRGIAYDTLFIGNKGKDGGALFHSGEFYRCVFTNNIAYRSGGAASTYDGGSFTFVNCLFVGNSAGDGDHSGSGSVLKFRDTNGDSAVFENCTIVGNRAYNIGSALYGDRAVTNIFATNCIIYANIDSSNGSTNNYNDKVVISYSLTTPMPPTGEGNITAAPKFVGDANYHLKWGSPGIDQGMTIASITDDLDGNPRPVDGSGIGVALYDMGCYETVALPPPGGTIIIVN